MNVHGPSLGPRTQPSSSFDRAIERFSCTLTAKQRQEFKSCSLEDVYSSIITIQDSQGNRNAMRNMARIQAFLEAMDEYRKVIEAFLNCTPFMGYVWGPIRFILLATNSWVTSLDVILNAYKQIQERLPSFMQYRELFDKNLEMRRALELYFCDILEFHYNALKILSRPGWKKLFASFWKTFDARFQCILNSLSRHKDLIESEKSTIALFEAQRTRELAENHFKIMEDAEKKRQLSLILEKLEAPDYQTDHQAACEQRRKSRSGSWIVQHDAFRHWADINNDSNNLLYINGIPGAGKTTLASKLIEVLLEKAMYPVLFFYCKQNIPAKHTFNGILRALVAQLSCKDQIIASYMHDVCCTKDHASVLSQIEEIAKVMFDSQITAFVVIDGLDECASEEVEKILSFFTARQREKAMPGHGQVRLLCVSQRTDIILHMLSKAPQISLENPEHQYDIRKFIEQQAQSIRSEFDISVDLEREIAERVSNVSKSMFLFAKLVMENLLNQTSRNDLLKELDPGTFPVDLKNAYERIVATIYKSGPHRTAAIRIIEWVACARRPLRWGEVQATFFIDPHMSNSDFQGGKLRKTAKRLCGSLIDVNKEDDKPEADAIIYLVHETARDYLQQHKLLNLQLQHAKIASYCVSYLISQPFNLMATEVELKTYFEDGYFAFLNYAASYWLDHLKAGLKQTPDPDALKDIYDKLTYITKNFLSENQVIHDSNFDVLNGNEFGLFDVVQDIADDAVARNQWAILEMRIWRVRGQMEMLAQQFKDNQDPKCAQLVSNIYGEMEFKCLKLGCSHFQHGFRSRSERDRHLDRHQRPFRCVESQCPLQNLGFPDKTSLERHESRYHRKQDEYGWPLLLPTKNTKNAKADLYRAARKGDIDVLQSLISSGVFMDLKAEHSQALRLAVEHGHLDMCRFLVDNAAFVSSSIMHAVIRGNDVEMIQYFLSLIDDIQIMNDKSGKSILHEAAANNADIAVKMLLSRADVNPDARDRKRRTPLHLAVQAYNLKIVRLLLATAKVDPNAKTSEGETPLSIAAAFQDATVASALLATGKVDPDGKAKHQNTPLMVAAGQGSKSVVKILLATNRVDPNAKNRYGMCPLIAASVNGYTDVASMLLYNPNIDPNATDNIGMVPLWHAIRGDHIALVKVLLQRPSIRLDTKDPSGEPLLVYAIEKGKTEIVSMLLASGLADVNAVDTSMEISGRTPLMVAVESRSEGMVKMLLDTGKVNVNWIGPHRPTALQIAESMGNQSMIDLLRAAGAKNFESMIPHSDVDFPLLSPILEQQNKKNSSDALPQPLNSINRTSNIMSLLNSEPEEPQFSQMMRPPKGQNEERLIGTVDHAIPDYQMQLMLQEEQNKNDPFDVMAQPLNSINRTSNIMSLLNSEPEEPQFSQMMRPPKGQNKERLISTVD